jgi:transcriptional regulator with XRE-family HTH domain
MHLFGNRQRQLEGCVGSTGRWVLGETCDPGQGVGCGCSLSRMMTGEELRRERGRARLTQRQLAARAGVGLRTITTWEARGSRPLPGTAEGRLAIVLGPGDDGPMHTLADFSDAELIEELAHRLGVPRIRVNSDPNRGVRPLDGVRDVTTNEMTERRPFPARRFVADDYPADASAQATIGTPAE